MGSQPKAFLLRIAIGFLTAALLLKCDDSTSPSAAHGTGSTTETGIQETRPGIGGVLFSSETGSPVSGAMVRVLEVGHLPGLQLGKRSALEESTTDSAGRYFIPVSSPGTYTVTSLSGTSGSYRDSVYVGVEQAVDLGADTLKPLGGFSGTVQLLGGHDARTVIIMCIGTHHITVPMDASGAFAFETMAEGRYSVRFLSTIDEYAPFDTTITVTGGQMRVLPQPFVLPHKGLPVVVGTTVEWNADRLFATVSWNDPGSEKVVGYHVFRSIVGNSPASYPANQELITDTSWVDTTLLPGMKYHYTVKAVDIHGNLATRYSNSDTVKANPSRSVTQSITLEGEFNRSLRKDFVWTVGLREIFLGSANKVQVIGLDGRQRSFSVPSMGEDEVGFMRLFNQKLLRMFNQKLHLLVNPGVREGKKWTDSTLTVTVLSLAGDLIERLEYRIDPGLFPQLGGALTDFLTYPTGDTDVLRSDGKIIRLFQDGTSKIAENPLTMQNLRPGVLALLDDKVVVHGSIRRTGGGGTTIHTEVALLSPDLSVFKSRTLTEFLPGTGGMASD